jgi:hypothetical protein
MFKIFCSEGLKGRIHLEDLGVDGSIILTWNFLELYRLNTTVEVYDVRDFHGGVFPDSLLL